MRGVQIKNIITRTLELSTGSYNQWRNLMELAVAEYGVLDHLLSDATPSRLDVEWHTIDLILKRWIYGLISPELTGMIMDQDKTARQLYLTLAAVFLNNKRHRAVHLTSDLYDQRQGSLGIAQYCARIKTIADALRDVDQPVSDDALVTVLVRGLNDRHHVTGKILLAAARSTSFDDARNALLLDEMQARASERVASQSALIALGRGDGGGGGSGGGHHGFGTYGPQYGTFSPSPNQGKTKRKRVTNNGGYTTNGAASPHYPEQRPWAGYVHAWPASSSAGRFPGILGPRPSAHAYAAAFANAPPGSMPLMPIYAAPPSVQQAPLYGVPPPAPPQQLLIPGHGQAFGTAPPPHYQAPPPEPPQYQPPEHGHSFEQSALIGALTDLSLGGGQPGPWIADSGASTHLSANPGSSNTGAPPSLQQ